MNQPNTEKIEQLFSEALEIPVPNRKHWLKKACGDDNALLDEVASLLDAYSQYDSKNFLSIPVNIKQEITSPDLSGRRIGAYKVESLIAKGGMGSVYLARRADGMYEKTVALKVVEFNGVESKLFKRERQILASLDYPNMVTLLDGGTLEEGFPYLVMEYVNGLPIDKYIKTDALNTRSIVKLVCKLADVVQKAHNRTIIHCDLKPGNILVTNEGILKLLDFGISQMLLRSVEQAEDNALCFALTPEYSSPQRCNNKPPMVTDDVFSLGVIFAQVLTGKIPPTKTSDKHTFAELDRKKMAKGIKNKELRAIFYKATHPEIKQRYVSAQAIIDDMKAWLVERPITAMGNNFLYRFYKYIVRNKKTWIASFLITILVIFAIWAWIDRIKTAELAIEKENEGARSLFTDMIKTLSSLPEGSDHR